MAKGGAAAQSLRDFSYKPSLDVKIEGADGVPAPTSLAEAHRLKRVAVQCSLNRDFVKTTLEPASSSPGSSQSQPQPPPQSLQQNKPMIEVEGKAVPIELSREAHDLSHTEEITDEIRNKPETMLSPEQKAVLHLVIEGRQNIFFTGAAGTGKSVLLRCIIDHLKKRYQRQPDSVAITATTGIAACNIGGTTVHSFAGIGLGQDDVPHMVRKIKRNRRSLSRWDKVKVLLIDEVSMLSAELLDKLEAVAREVRGNQLPFGGIQLVLTGDLFQLPPISREGSASFCFEANCWPALVDRTVNLTQIFRQADPHFARILNELREGEVSDDTQELFQSLCRPVKIPKGLIPTRLFPRRDDVDNANQRALERLKGTAYEYLAEDYESNRAKQEGIKIDQHCIAPQHVKLREGAQVMMLKNIDSTVVNGSIGKVVGFMSQTDFSGAKASGKGTSAVYDERALGITDNPSDPINIRKSERLRQLTELHGKSEARWPLVRFMTPSNLPRYMLVMPESWAIQTQEGDILASRVQIPLMLAWALSIHKAQGQTLQYLSVNLERIFETGQAYVAISRATSIDGLQLMRFNRNKVRVNPRVRDFYHNLGCLSSDDIREAEEYFAFEYHSPRAPAKKRSARTAVLSSSQPEAGPPGKRAHENEDGDGDEDFIPESDPFVDVEIPDAVSGPNQGPNPFMQA